ncbi:MAG: hypothetical protein RIT45_1678 [Pseudomonadota bacterium]|jgi:hypothetical protein
MRPATWAFAGWLALCGAGCAGASDGGEALVDGGVDVTGDAATDSTTDSSDTDAAADPLCNGSAALCTRTLAELCLPGAHNAMSSAAEGWSFPNQNVAFTALLDQGIRALLLDVYRWDDPDDDGGEADAGPELWLCHSNCLLGKRRFSEALAGLRTWLDAHPRELVFIVLEDPAPAAEVKAAIDAADLRERAAELDPTALPTLGALLDAGKQLVWTAEQKGGAPAPGVWYHDVWKLVQDTPYTFRSQQELRTYSSDAHSCRPNRGAADAPLLQVNHWVAKILPTVEQSAAANTLDVLLERAAACEALRGRKVNILAVDHADMGEVVRAARILNGLEAAP